MILNITPKNFQSNMHMSVSRGNKLKVGYIVRKYEASRSFVHLHTQSVKCAAE